jgi:hypothetical protein
MPTYDLDTFYNIYKTGFPYILNNDILDLINSIDKVIVPIVSEKKIDTVKKRRVKPVDDWADVRTNFKTTTIIEEKDDIDKWLQDIRFALNKLSAKNYETQRDQIFICVDKCLGNEDETEKNDNLKSIAIAIFTIASTNKFFAEIYAKLYKELMEKQSIFQEILSNHVGNYANTIKDYEYVDSDVDYEKYCINNKKNDSKKASAVFLVNLMKKRAVSVLRILNIMVSFQTWIMELIDVENKTNEVDEVTEILFLFMSEGKDVYEECKGEWIWKFVIKQNIETLAKFSKKDKKSLSSRAIFKYMDMVKLI